MSQRNPELCAETDNRVLAIRGDKVVGRGSCSSIDECLDDEDLRAELEQDKVQTPDDAIEWARQREGLFLEQGLNQRWGSDDDTELKAWREFREKCAS